MQAGRLVNDGCETDGRVWAGSMACRLLLVVVLHMAGWPLATVLAQSLAAAVCLTAALGPHAAVALAAAAAHQVELDVI